LKTVVQSKSNDDDKKKINKKEEFELTMGELLEILDGMVEMPGRMMIMTSNHPEMLDPAILRPGRIDLQIHFKNLMRENIADMYRLWFNNDIPEEYYKRINDYTFSQAEIGNLFSTYDNKHILNTLVSK
jgi:SpoVK/Ycf46/Vps4 family AAA+-type ATPase